MSPGRGIAHGHRPPHIHTAVDSTQSASLRRELSSTLNAPSSFLFRIVFVFFVKSGKPSGSGGGSRKLRRFSCSSSKQG